MMNILYKIVSDKILIYLAIFILERRIGLMDQTHICGNKNTIVTSKKVVNNPVPVAANNRRKSSLSLKQKQPSSLSSMAQKYSSLFVLLSIILLGVVIGCSIWIINLRMKYNN